MFTSVLYILIPWKHTSDNAPVLAGSSCSFTASFTDKVSSFDIACNNPVKHNHHLHVFTVHRSLIAFDCNCKVHDVQCSHPEYEQSEDELCGVLF